MRYGGTPRRCPAWALAWAAWRSLGLLCGGLVWLPGCLHVTSAASKTASVAAPAAGLQVNHEDFNEAITEVQAKKKASLQYYA